MPRFDVLLVPCVTVKVAQIDAPTMADAVKKAEDIAGLPQLFTPVNRALPPGVAWVEWTEECSHCLVDEFSPDSDEPINSQFLNTQCEPVAYDHTTGFMLQLLETGTVLHTFGPYRRITMEEGYFLCAPWRQSDVSRAFVLTAEGLI